MYIDVHKREDVVRHRGVYLHTMVALRASHQPPPVCSDEQPRVQIEGDEQKKRLVIIYHDSQSTTVMRGRHGCGRRKRDQLSCRRRRGVVQWCRTSWKNTSVFCASDDQYRRAKVGSPSISQLTRVAFEYGSECGGYWTGKIFLAQMKTACNIAEFKLSTHCIHTGLYSSLTRAAITASLMRKFSLQGAFWLRMECHEECEALSGQASFSQWQPGNS